MITIMENRDYIITETSLKDLGLEYDTIGKLCITGYSGAERAVFEIKEWLEGNYRMYQYDKGNGVRYGEHELFYWNLSDDSLYFTIDIEHKNVDDAQRVSDEIVSYIKSNHNGADGSVTLQYESVLRWDAINQFVAELDISAADGLPLPAIARIAYEAQYVSDTLTFSNREKLHSLETKLLGAMRDKRVYYTIENMNMSIKGTLCQLTDGKFVVKPRATKLYFPVELQNITKLKIA